MSNVLEPTKARELTDRLNQACRGAVLHYVHAAEILNDCNASKCWISLGYKTKGEWIDHELTIGKSQVNNLERIWLQYGMLFSKQPEVIPPNMRNLVKILPITEQMDEPNKIEWLHKAGSLREPDLIEEIHNYRNGEDCKHVNKAEKITIYCEDCGKSFGTSKILMED